jgi:hypothetical protein
MAWACNTANNHLPIATDVFLHAGLVLIYLANLFFAQRMLRAQHPQYGWRKLISCMFVGTVLLTIAATICSNIAVIASSYLRNDSSIRATRVLERIGTTVLAVVATLPMLIVGISRLLRWHPRIRMTKTIDKFGEGSMRAKADIVILSSFLLSLSAWFRVGVVFHEPIPLSTAQNETTSQPGYLSKPCFYVLILLIELSVCVLWLIVRIDERFFIPDGAKGPSSYAGGFVFAGEVGNEKTRVSAAMSSLHDISRPASRRSSVASRPASRRASIVSRPTSSGGVSIVPVSKRASWAGSVASRNKQEQMEKRISWGGVSRENVKDITDEEGNVVPYPAFADGDTAADIGVEGTEQELGFDPESGHWAVRPISQHEDDSIRPSASHSRIATGLSTNGQWQAGDDYVDEYYGNERGECA